MGSNRLSTNLGNSLLLNNDQLISKLSQIQPLEHIEDGSENIENARAGRTAGSVQRALDQIESYRIENKLRDGNMPRNGSFMQDDDISVEVLEQRTGAPRDASLDALTPINDIDPRRSPQRLRKDQDQKRKREVFPLATVNIMSGAHTLDKSPRQTNASPRGLATT